jgi:hypothetical protein
LAAGPPLLRDVYDIVAPAIPHGYDESIQFGMVSWSVPLERYPDTYNTLPLSYVALAAQKQYVALYLALEPETDAAFRSAWTQSGRRLDMGKSCLRLRKPGDVNAELLRGAVAAASVDDFIAAYERSRS